jgi:hypothetical protein
MSRFIIGTTAVLLFTVLLYIFNKPTIQHRPITTEYSKAELKEIVNDLGLECDVVEKIVFFPDGGNSIICGNNTVTLFVGPSVPYRGLLSEE